MMTPTRSRPRASSCGRRTGWATRCWRCRRWRRCARHFAGAQLTIAATPAVAALFREDTDVRPDRVIELPVATARARSRRSTAGSFDLGILFPNSFRSAWQFWRAGIPSAGATRRPAAACCSRAGAGAATARGPSASGRLLSRRSFAVSASRATTARAAHRADGRRASSAPTRSCAPSARRDRRAARRPCARARRTDRRSSGRPIAMAA